MRLVFAEDVEKKICALCPNEEICASGDAPIACGYMLAIDSAPTIKVVDFHVINDGEFEPTNGNNFKIEYGWISVKDSLPEANIDVLVHALGKDTLFSSKQDKVKAITSMSDSNILFPDIKCEKWWREPFQYFNSDYVITHWRYLPDDPEIDIT